MVGSMRRVAKRAIAFLAAQVLSACGYHVAGRSNSLPKSIHVIAVPALENKTSTYKIEQKLTTATIHEFLSKTNFRVVSDPQNGDVVLTGKVLSIEVVPVLFQSDSATSASTWAQATAMIVTMKCEVTVTERDNDK